MNYKARLIAEDRHDGTVADDGTADWAGYYASSAGRAPRPLLLAACEELGAGQDRMAIDLGCGEGTDALELLARGWLVLAVDAQPTGLALLRARIPPRAAGRIRVLCASFAEADLPSAQLIHAGYSLPFCPPRGFPVLWARIRQALAPGAVFAGQLFGTRDTWADDPDMTFHTRHQVEVLLDGLDIVRLEEIEQDGHAFSGPKHWHTFDILARRAGRLPQVLAVERRPPRLMWPQLSDDADDLPGCRAAPCGLAAAGPRGQRVGTGVLRALRPGRGASGGGELLDLPLLELVREIGEPLRGGEADLDADALGTGTAARRLDPCAHAVRSEVVVCLLEDVRHDGAAAAHVLQDRFQVGPQFRALGIGQRPRIAGQPQ